MDGPRVKALPKVRPTTEIGEEIRIEELRVEVKAGAVEEWTNMMGFSLYAAGSVESFREGIEKLKPLVTDLRIVRVTTTETREVVELE